MVKKTDLHMYGYLIYYKSAIAVLWGRDSIFSKCCRVHWLDICEFLKCSLTPTLQYREKSIPDYHR